MANINAPSIEYFESFAAEVQSKFERVKRLTSNKSASGDYHEEVIRTILRNFLTKRFSVKNGFIFKSEDEISNQVDILIIDENSPAAYLFQEGDFAIVLPESVIAAIEVKTTLNAQDFDSAIKNIASVKSLSGAIRGIIFAYRGTSPSDENLDSWFKRSAALGLKGKHHLGPEAIMFFEAGMLLMQFDEEGSPKMGERYFKKVYRENDKKDTGWQLSIVLALILAACESADVRRTHFFADSTAQKLIQMKGSMASLTRFSFGEGLSSNKLEK